MRFRIAVVLAFSLLMLAGIGAGEAGARRPCAPHCRRVEREQRRTEREERHEQNREQAKEREEEKLEEEGLLEELFPEREEPGGTALGVDTSRWTGSLIGELSSAGIGNLRVQSQAAVTVAAEAPGHIGSIVFGGGGAIGTINPTTYAAEVLTVSTLTHPRAIEVLNEPNNPGFWSDTTNYSAYAKLAKAVHEALQTLPAALRPAELCSWDGGEGPSSSWGAAIKAAGALNYCDGVTVHPYGGSKGQDGGALGGRRDVELAHANSGMPVYITEIGWPTAVGQPSTGDSQQWTEAQQAENMKNFATWAQQTGYVPMVTFFNAVDYGTNSFYGIETSSRKHKQSYATLAELSR